MNTRKAIPFMVLIVLLVFPVSSLSDRTVYELNYPEDTTFYKNAEYIIDKVCLIEDADILLTGYSVDSPKNNLPDVMQFYIDTGDLLDGDKLTAFVARIDNANHEIWRYDYPDNNKIMGLKIKGFLPKGFIMVGAYDLRPFSSTEIDYFVLDNSTGERIELDSYWHFLYDVQSFWLTDTGVICQSFQNASITPDNVSTIAFFEYHADQPVLKWSTKESALQGYYLNSMVESGNGFIFAGTRLTTDDMYNAAAFCLNLDGKLEWTHTSSAYGKSIFDFAVAYNHGMVLLAGYSVPADTNSDSTLLVRVNQSNGDVCILNLGIPSGSGITAIEKNGDGYIIEVGSNSDDFPSSRFYCLDADENIIPLASLSRQTRIAQHVSMLIMNNMCYVVGTASCEDNIHIGITNFCSLIAK